MSDQSSASTTNGVNEPILQAPNKDSMEPPAILLKKVLVPVDFSLASNHALKYAIAFGRQFQAELILLHVVEFALLGSEYGIVELPQIESELCANAQKQIDELARQQISPPIKFETKVMSGRPYAEIIQTAEDEQIDVIIIATHGHASLAHVLLGSTVERVVRYAPCPVLVVRKQEHDFVGVG